MEGEEAGQVISKNPLLLLLSAFSFVIQVFLGITVMQQHYITELYILFPAGPLISHYNLHFTVACKVFRYI